jgi:hypothetical protein
MWYIKKSHSKQNKVISQHKKIQEKIHCNKSTKIILKYKQIKIQKIPNPKPSFSHLNIMNFTLNNMNFTPQCLTLFTVTVQSYNNFMSTAYVLLVVNK